MKIIAILALLALVIGCVVGVNNMLEAEKARYNEWVETREVITIIIEKGDTIDGYYAEYAPEWMDRYEWREEIRDLNNLKSCAIYAGETIKLYA